MKQQLRWYIFVAGLLWQNANGASQIPVAAPMSTELAGATADVAIPSVFRIICPSTKSGGSGFLHKSGYVVTAQHVINNHGSNDVLVITARGQLIHVTNIIEDAILDLAILMPRDKLNGPCLQISTNPTLRVGMQVSTWGFPEGYQGMAPLLTSGYISGLDFPDANKGNKTPKLVVNAAFNRGNSGGPLVEIEKGMIVGVVCSKLAPLPREVERFLNVLKNNTGTGVGFERTKADGSTDTIMEGQIIEEILQYLRSQTQLVIGYACSGGDLVQFLRRNGIQP
jgi:S1-C subfamily serine protease